MEEGAAGGGGGSRLAFGLLSAGLVLFGGLMSGLTLGLMGLDLVELEVLRRSGTPKQKREAREVSKLLKHPHLILVTLLLCNAAALEALPLTLHRVVGEVGAIVLSVTAVLLFGEIIPQAICKTHSLAIGAKCVWVVRAFQVLTFPVSYPLARLLDRLLGEQHGALLRRPQLTAFVDLHAENSEWGGELSIDETNVITGALKLSAKPAAFAMTPLDKVFMLPQDLALGRAELQSILESGFSRIPVHEAGDPGHILGMIIVKELVTVDPDAGVRICDAARVYNIPRMSARTPLYDVLNIMQTGRAHMVLLTYDPVPECEPSPDDGPLLGEMAGAEGGEAGATWWVWRVNNIQQQALELTASCSGGAGSAVAEGNVGVVTMEDIMEELLQEEIVDETDRFVDNLQRVMVDTAKLVKGLHPRLQALANTTRAKEGEARKRARPSGLSAEFQDRRSAKLERMASLRDGGSPTHRIGFPHSPRCGPGGPSSPRAAADPPPDSPFAERSFGGGAPPRWGRRGMGKRGGKGGGAGRTGRGARGGEAEGPDFTARRASEAAAAGAWWATSPRRFPDLDPDRDFGPALGERLQAAMDAGVDLRPGHGSCARCGRTASDLGRPLEACSRCGRVDYCDGMCATAHMPSHLAKRGGSEVSTCTLLQRTEVIEAQERLRPGAAKEALRALVPWQGPAGTDWKRFFTGRSWKWFVWPPEGPGEGGGVGGAPKHASKRRRLENPGGGAPVGRFEGGVPLLERMNSTLLHQPEAKEAVMCLASEAASYPLTLAWALQNLRGLGSCCDLLRGRRISTCLPSSREFCVHVLGASEAECWEPQVWALAAQATTVAALDGEGPGDVQPRRLRVNMVGPDVPESLDGRSVDLKRGDGMLSDGVTVSGCRISTYKSYTDLPDAGRPDLVVGYNMGWTVPTYDWEPSLEVIPAGCLVLATTNSEAEASFDVGFGEEHDLDCEWVGENPFHSLRVHQSGTAADDVYRKNSYAMIFRKRMARC